MTSSAYRAIRQSSVTCHGEAHTQPTRAINLSAFQLQRDGHGVGVHQLPFHGAMCVRSPIVVIAREYKWSCSITSYFRAQIRALAPRLVTLERSLGVLRYYERL